MLMDNIMVWDNFWYDQKTTNLPSLSVSSAFVCLFIHTLKLFFFSVVIVDPGIKMESGYAPYEDGLKMGIFIKVIL